MDLGHSSFRISKWTHLLCGIMLVATVFILLQNESEAQTPNQQPVNPGLPTQAQVQQLIEKTTNDKTLEETKKNEVIRAYNQTLVNLRSIEDWDRQAQQFETLRNGAPERLQALRSELAETEDPLPEIPSDGTLPEIEGLLTTTKASVEATSKEVDQLTTEAGTRSERRRSIPQQLVQLRQSLTNTQQELSALPPIEGSETPLLSANHQQLATLAEALAQQIRALEAEIQSYEARGELLTARQEVASRRLARLKKVEELYQNATNHLRDVATRKAEREAREALRDVKDVPLLAQLAERNQSLAEKRTEVSKAIQALGEELRKAEDQLRRIESDFKDTKNRVGVAGLTGPLGLLLRQQRDTLPAPRSLRREIEDIASRLGETELSRIELEIERTNFAEDPWNEELALLSDGVGTWSREEISAKAAELAAGRRDLFRSLLEDYHRTSDALVDLDTSRRSLLGLTTEYRSFVDERILWIRSTVPLWREDGRLLLDGARPLISPRSWSTCTFALGEDVVRNPAIATGIGLLLLGLFAFRPRFQKRLRICGETASRGSCTSITPTIAALLITLFLVAGKPLALWLIGWRLGSVIEPTDFVRGVGAGFRAGAVYLLALDSLRQIIRPKGLGESHFRWSPESIRLLRRSIRLLGLPGLLLVVTVSILQSQGPGAQAAVARVGFLIGMILLLLFLYPVLHPSRGVVAPRAQRVDLGSWAQRMRGLWFLLGIAGPLGLFILALLGYHFTATRLFDRFSVTAWLVFVGVILNAFVLRVLLLARRKLLLKQVQERMAARESTPDADPPKDSLQDVDVATVDLQSRQLVRGLIAVGLAIGAWLTWSEVFPALAFLDQVELWSSTTVSKDDDTTRVPITLANLVIAATVVILTIIAGKNLPGLLEISLLQKLRVNPGERYAIKTLSQYAIVLLGIVYGFSKLGIGWSNIQWLAAALTVGLGFGLQEIFANFFSGLILLFERPIRVGDIVTVDTIDGRVSRIQMRATTITDWNNRELIVPNKQFVTGSLVNWTLTDPVTRVVIPVGVAYGSDIKLVRSTLLKIGEASPLTMDDPAPSALYRSFGDSALNFELRVFIASRDLWPDLINSLHEEIDLEFRKLGIEIAFPQRDLHIRSADGLVSLEPRQDRPSSEPPPSSAPDEWPTTKKL